MTGSILEDLKQKHVIHERNAADLRDYILTKYPQLPSQKRAVIFSNAIHRILERKMPEFEQSDKDILISILLREAVERARFSIDCAHVFEVALKSEIDDEGKYSVLSQWFDEVVQRPMAGEELRVLAEKISMLLQEGKVLDFEEALFEIDQSLRMDSAKASAVAQCILYECVLNEAQIDDEVLNYDEISSHNDILNEDKTSSQDKIEIREMPIMHRWMGMFLQLAQITKKPRTAFIAVILAFVILTFQQFFGSKSFNADAMTPFNDRAIIGEAYYIEQSEEIETIAGTGITETVTKVCDMRATAYDLSIESCGKERGHPAYGITSSGQKATVGRTVAVDPEVVPIGARMYIVFPEAYKSFDGVYIAEDTGRLIKGNKIDLFMGEDKPGEEIIHQQAMNFGVRDVKVYVLE